MADNSFTVENTGLLNKLQKVFGVTTNAAALGRALALASIVADLAEKAKGGSDKELTIKLGDVEETVTIDR